MAVLLPGDLFSPTWLKLKKHYEERLDYWRAMNDGSHDAAKTERIRGRIAECKVFLALAYPPTPQESDDVK